MDTCYVYTSWGAFISGISYYALILICVHVARADVCVGEGERKGEFSLLRFVLLFLPRGPYARAPVKFRSKFFVYDFMCAAKEKKKQDARSRNLIERFCLCNRASSDASGGFLTRFYGNENSESNPRDSRSKWSYFGFGRIEKHVIRLKTNLEDSLKLVMAIDQL